MLIITKATLESLAPDQSALNEAHKLFRSGKWVTRAGSGEDGHAWAEFQGSGSAPYRLAVSLNDLGYRCSCPSRKFPCKHVLALFWTVAQSPELVVRAETPDWVREWQQRRRPKSETGTTTRAESASATLATQDSTDAPRDVKTEARTAQQRERLRAEREASVSSALHDLDNWILDQLQSGLSAFLPHAAERCRAAAKRLVDGKASGAAAMLDQMAVDLFAVPEAARDDLLLARLGELHLLVSAYDRQGEIPPALREDVRRIAGWTLSREELLAHPLTTRVRSGWRVAGRFAELQADRLRRTETWLMRAQAGAEPDVPRFAVLIDFQPASAGSAFPFTNGEAITAELAFYPSSAPLRAVIVDRVEADAPAWPTCCASLQDALAEYESALARQPWLTCWPLALDNVQIVGDRVRGFVLAGTEGNAVLPIAHSQGGRVLPLLGLSPLDVTGLWDGSVLRLLTAASPIGRWFDA